jgi:hypothetical protein
VAISELCEYWAGEYRSIARAQQTACMIGMATHLRKSPGSDARSLSWGGTDILHVLSEVVWYSSNSFLLVTAFPGFPCGPLAVTSDKSLVQRPKLIRCVTKLPSLSPYL